MAISPTDLLYDRHAVHAWEAYIDTALKKAKMLERRVTWRVTPPSIMWRTSPLLGPHELFELRRRYVLAGWKDFQLMRPDSAPSYFGLWDPLAPVEDANAKVDANAPLPAVARGSEDVPERSEEDIQVWDVRTMLPEAPDEVVGVEDEEEETA